MQGSGCDRGGEFVLEEEHSTLLLVLKGPDGQVISTNGDNPGGTIDLCAKDARAVANIVRTRIITTDTREGAWFDSEAADTVATPDAD